MIQAYNAREGNYSRIPKTKEHIVNIISPVNNLPCSYQDDVEIIKLLTDDTIVIGYMYPSELSDLKNVE